MNLPNAERALSHEATTPGAKRAPDAAERDARVFFWSTLLPIAAATAFVVAFVAPLIAAPAPSREQIAAEFIAALVEHCRPEGLEQLRYVLAVLVPVALMAAALLLRRRRGPAASAATPSSLTSRTPLGVLSPPRAWTLRWARPKTALALGAQGLLLVTALAAWAFEDWRGMHYFREPAALAWAVMGGAAVWLYRHHRAPQGRQHLVRFAAWCRARPSLASLTAVAWTAAFLLTCVFSDASLAHAFANTRYHLDFTMGEFAATMNGRTPLVDLMPQYQNLSPVLLSPWFRLLGLSVTTYTLTMGALSLGGLLFIYSVYVRVTASRWRALVLYLPFVGHSLHPAHKGEGGLYENAFNYFGVGPLRYFGLLLLAAATAWYLAQPSRRRLALVSTLAGAVALNNLDFGVPSALGVLFCALLFAPPARRSLLATRVSRLIHALRTAAVGIGGTLAGFALGLLVLRLHGGAWPELAALVEYQRSFAQVGFFMLPLPPLGMYGLLYLSFMAAILIALAASVTPGDDSAAARVQHGMLAYGGVAGLGALTYYIGRSHAYVLTAVFCAWGLVLGLLAWRAWLHWRGRGLPWRPGAGLGTIVRVAPSVATLALCLALLPDAMNVPSPLTQGRRLSTPPAGAPSGDADAVALVRKYVPAGRPTVVVYPRGHWLALQAGVDNRSPFVHPGSLLLRRQVDLLMGAIDRLPLAAKYVFGQRAPCAESRECGAEGELAPHELTVRLRQAGFAPLDAVGTLVVWSKRS